MRVWLPRSPSGRSCTGWRSGVDRSRHDPFEAVGRQVAPHVSTAGEALTRWLVPRREAASCAVQVRPLPAAWSPPHRRRRPVDIVARRRTSPSAPPGDGGLHRPRSRRSPAPTLMAAMVAEHRPPLADRCCRDRLGPAAGRYSAQGAEWTLLRSGRRQASRCATSPPPRVAGRRRITAAPVSSGHRRDPPARSSTTIPEPGDSARPAVVVARGAAGRPGPGEVAASVDDDAVIARCAAHREPPAWWLDVVPDDAPTPHRRRRGTTRRCDGAPPRARSPGRATAGAYDAGTVIAQLVAPGDVGGRPGLTTEIADTIDGPSANRHRHLPHPAAEIRS